MPFTFVDIEKRKSRVIGLFFALIVLFYFLTAYLALFLTESIYGGGLVLPPLKNTLFILAVAFFAALAHWLISINNLMERLLRALGAEPPEEKDAYHQLFKNIVEEVSIAIGGRPLKAVVIPSAAMNAFALEDFDRQAVIGVTEGLLARLSRPQIEAVTAHEAGHIVGGDCLSASVASALAEVYEVILEKLASLIRGAGARGLFLLALLYVLLRLVSFISLVLRFFISRQREYRADAVGVRLTRNPISLAEALQLISDGWRGEGGLGAKIETIFIVNPALNRFDETNGFFADVFSTHPPVQKRIAVLAAMAHLDEKTLEENIKNFKRVAPIAEAEISVKQKNIPRLWLALIDSQWQGPLPAADLGKLTAFRPDTWVRLQNEEAVKPAYEYEELIRLFKKSQAGQEKKTPLCPHCRAPLAEILYEGAPLWKCSYCAGVLTEQAKVSRILIRRDKEFSPEIKRQAQIIVKEQQRLASAFWQPQAQNAWQVACPACGKKMRRQFFVHSYPVEIDLCVSCGGIWFDVQELELLQYIYEHREEFFDLWSKLGLFLLLPTRQ